MYRRRIFCTLYGAVDSLIVPSKGLYGCGGSFMHLSGPSRAIKFLYAPAPLPPTVRALWAEFDAISHDPKKLSISRAQPPPTCPSNGCCPHQKHYAREHINHGCINSY